MKIIHHAMLLQPQNKLLCLLMLFAYGKNMMNIKLQSDFLILCKILLHEYSMNLEHKDQ